MTRLPIIVLSGGFSPAHIAFALFGPAITGSLVLVFRQEFVQRIAGRRALRAGRGIEERGSAPRCVATVGTGPDRTGPVE